MAIIRDTEPFSKAYPPAPAPPAFSATAALTSFQPSTSSLLTDSFRSGNGLDPSLSRSTWMQAGAAPSAPSILGTSSPLSGSALDGQMARLAADQSRQLDLPQIDFRDNSLPLLSDSLTPA